MILKMKLASILIRFALAVTLLGAGLAMYFLREANWVTALIQLGLCVALVLCGWGILRVVFAMERTRKITHVLRNYDLDERLGVDGEKAATRQCGKEHDPGSSKIQPGAPPPGSLITRR